MMRVKVLHKLSQPERLERLKGFDYDIVEALPLDHPLVVSRATSDRTRAKASIVETFLKAVKEAKDEGLDWVIVLEDDVEFHKDFNYVKAVLDTLPSTWELCSLGAYLLVSRPEQYHFTKVSPCLAKIQGRPPLLGTHALAFSSKLYDRWAEEFSRPNLIDGREQVTQRMLATTESYIMFPMACGQRLEFSGKGSVSNIGYVLSKWKESHITIAENLR